MVETDQSMPRYERVLYHKIRNRFHLRRLEYSKYINMKCKLECKKCNDNENDCTNKSFVHVQKYTLHSASLTK